MIKSYEKIAKILRTDKDNLRIIEERLGSTTGKKNVMDKIVEENESVIKNRLDSLGLKMSASAKEIYDALIKKIEDNNRLLFEFFGRPSAVKSEDWIKILAMGEKLADKPIGFFLKKEKAAEFLKSQPPLQVLKILGYCSVDEMLANEDIFEIYSSLRFVEGSDWLNKVFFKQYEKLKPADFEYREIITKALSEKWAILAQDFIRKKHHNISHLKELGVIFVIPLALDISSEIIRNFSLILHYFNEIPFYSSLFEKFAKEVPTSMSRDSDRSVGKNNFANNVISLLRGDVFDRQLPESKKSRWLVVQRYLAKDDENDWRLFVPHINPEALHWEKAGRMLVRAGKLLNGLSAGFIFWQNLDWVGDYYKSDVGIDVLVSFNLVDTAMSLVKSKEMVKYLYHHQESLWNRIFAAYFGEEKLEEIMKENIIKGYFEI